MRMLGRFASPPCCAGTRAGRPPGPDCSGGERSTRKAKRREQRETAREIRAETKEGGSGPKATPSRLQRQHSWHVT